MRFCGGTHGIPFHTVHLVRDHFRQSVETGPLGPLSPKAWG